MNSTHENIIRCRAQFEQVMGLLHFGLHEKDPNYISDAVDAYADLISLCASTGLYSAITSYQTEFRALLDTGKSTFVQSIKGYKQRQHLLEKMCQSIGQHSTEQLLATKKTTRSGNHSSVTSETIHDHATFYRAKLNELLFTKDPGNIENYRVDLLSEARNGHYQSIQDAISLASTLENGSDLLRKMNLWKSLSEFSPKKRTKDSHLKLPDSLKKVISHHQKLVADVLEMEKGNVKISQWSDKIFIEIWVIKDLFDYGLRDLSGYALDTIMGNGTITNISRLSKSENSYRNISAIWNMGREQDARKLNLYGNASDNVFDVVSSLVCAIEIPAISISDFKLALNSFTKKTENHSKTLRASHLWLALHELARAYHDGAEPKAQEKIDLFEGFVADFMTRINDPYVLRKVKEFAPDIHERIVNHNQFKRGVFSNDMGL